MNIEPGMLSSISHSSETDVREWRETSRGDASTQRCMAGNVESSETCLVNILMDIDMLATSSTSPTSVSEQKCQSTGKPKNFDRRKEDRCYVVVPNPRKQVDCDRRAFIVKNDSNCTANISSTKERMVGKRGMSAKRRRQELLRLAKLYAPKLPVIPKNDLRREYARFFEHVFNSYSYTKMTEYLYTYYRGDFKYKHSVANPGRAATNPSDMVITHANGTALPAADAPKDDDTETFELNGIDDMAAFWNSVACSAPDGTFEVKNTKIKVRSDGTALVVAQVLNSETHVLAPEGSCFCAGSSSGLIDFNYADLNIQKQLDEDARVNELFGGCKLYTKSTSSPPQTTTTTTARAASPAATAVVYTSSSSSTSSTDSSASTNSTALVLSGNFSNEHNKDIGNNHPPLPRSNDKPISDAALQIMREERGALLKSMAMVLPPHTPQAQAPSAAVPHVSLQSSYQRNPASVGGESSLKSRGNTVEKELFFGENMPPHPPFPHFPHSLHSPSTIRSSSGVAVGPLQAVRWELRGELHMHLNAENKITMLEFNVNDRGARPL